MVAALRRDAGTRWSDALVRSGGGGGSSGDEEMPEPSNPRLFSA